MYHFTACGLDNVWLANGFEIKQTPFGEAVKINNLDGLHRAIARGLAADPSRLNGAEVRFLRSFLGVSQEGLGDIVDVTRATVARWEKNENRTKPIDGACSRLLRIFCMKQLEGNEKVGQMLDMLADVDAKQHGSTRMQLAAENNVWKQNREPALVTG